MKFWKLLSLLAGVSAVSGPSFAQQSENTIPPPPSRPAPAPEIGPNTRVYTPADIPQSYALSYPARAQDDEVEGNATVSCQVGDDYHLTKCVVLSEDPPGYGFGEATALQFLRFGLADPKTSKPGDWLRLTFKWALH